MARTEAPIKRAGNLLAISLALLATTGRAARASGESQPVSDGQVAPEEIEEIEEIEELEEIEEVTVEDLTQVPDRSSPSGWWDETNPSFDRAVSLHQPAVPRKHTLRMIIDHRASQPLTEDAFHNYLGFDGPSLKVGLGLRLSLLDDLEVGVYRLNNGSERFDTYEADVKYQALDQRTQVVDLGLRAGLTWFSQQDNEDATGALAQILVSRRFWDRLVLGTGVLYHSESTNGVKSNLDDDWSLALMGTVGVRIRRAVAWHFEVAYSVAGYGTRDKAGVDAWPVMSTSLVFITRRHSFSLVISNTQYTSADGYVSNSPRGLGDLVAGFAITREWNWSEGVSSE